LAKTSSLCAVCQDAQFSIAKVHRLMQQHLVDVTNVLRNSLIQIIYRITGEQDSTIAWIAKGIR